MDEDVPSPIDLRLPADAAEWESTAMTKRPFRTEFFARIETALRELDLERPRVLELGSGPGFLAERLVTGLGSVDYTALDFSPAMHALARTRLGEDADHVAFVERDFLDPRWTAGLGRFDAVVTVQAVHELRHKRRAATLHRQVREVLDRGASYLVCDHFVGDGGMTNPSLFMTLDEQRDALGAGGFVDVETLFVHSGMALHRAR